MKSWNVSFSAARGGRVWLGRLHYIHTSKNSNYESRSGRDSGTRVCANVRKGRLNEDTPCPYFPSRPQTRASLAGGLREGTRKPQPRSSREGDPLSCFACDRAVPQNVGLPAPRGKPQEKTHGEAGRTSRWLQSARELLGACARTPPVLGQEGKAACRGSGSSRGPASGEGPTQRKQRLQRRRGEKAPENVQEMPFGKV